jgi:hypothetical protein
VIVFKGGGLSSSGSRSGTGKGFGGLISYLQHGHRASADPERVAWTSGGMRHPRRPPGA